MNSLIVKYNTPNSVKSFMSAYQNTHLPKVQQLEGLISAAYYILDSDNDDFLIFIACFETPEALERAMGSNVGQALAVEAKELATNGLTLLTSTTYKVRNRVHK
jgi:hypothetical protein